MISGTLATHFTSELRSQPSDIFGSPASCLAWTAVYASLLITLLAQDRADVSPHQQTVTDVGPRRLCASPRGQQSSLINVSVQHFSDTLTLFVWLEPNRLK